MMKKIVLMGIACGLLGSVVAQTLYSPTRYVSIKTNRVPKPNGTVDLALSNFSPRLENDDNSNNLLDANERCRVRFKIKNNGTGTAYKLLLSIKQEKNVNGVSVSYNKEIGNLSSKESKEIVFDILANEYVGNKTEDLKISVSEGNGFDADPSIFSFQTQAFKYPQVVVADYKFSSDQGETLKPGKQATLEIMLQNKGQGQAKEVNVRFENPGNVFPAGEGNFNVNNLEPGQTYNVSYSFLVNKKFEGSEVPISVRVSESYGKYGEVKNCSIRMNQALAKTNQVKLEGTYAQGVAIQAASLTSDVDKNIPIGLPEDDNKYALIIGNEDYTSYQKGLNTEANVAFASSDANTFKEYCRKTLGVPEKNITSLSNATSGEMRKAIEKINKLIKVSNGKAKVLVFYAGHGQPDEQTKVAYLMPVDASATELEATGVQLAYLYQKLTEYPSKKVQVFIDACFSGGGRGVGLLAARGVKVRPQDDYLRGNIVVFTASSGRESALPYTEKQHGMFSYHLFKHLQETEGRTSMGMLKQYISETVPKESISVNNKEQTPQTLYSNDVSDRWEQWGFE